MLRLAGTVLEGTCRAADDRSRHGGDRGRTRRRRRPPARRPGRSPPGWIVSAAASLTSRSTASAAPRWATTRTPSPRSRRALPAAGVTAFCPTLVSRSPAAYRRAAAALARGRGAGRPRPRAPRACTWRARSWPRPVTAPTTRRPCATPTPEAVDRLLAAFAPGDRDPGARAAGRARGGAAHRTGRLPSPPWATPRPTPHTGRAAIAAGAAPAHPRAQRDARHRRPRARRRSRPSSPTRAPASR